MTLLKTVLFIIWQTDKYETSAWEIVRPKRVERLSTVDQILFLAFIFIALVVKIKFLVEAPRFVIDDLEVSPQRLRTLPSQNIVNLEMIIYNIIHMRWKKFKMEEHYLKGPYTIRICYFL